MGEDVTNAQFARSNKEFMAACEAVSVTPTLRQASKFRRKTGKAYKEGLPQVRGQANKGG